MMVDRVEIFPAAFTLTEHEPASRVMPEVRFEAEGVSRLAPAFEIDLETADRAWSGACFGGRDGLNLLINSPNPEVLVAVAGGVAYSVPVRSPEDYEVVPLRPVREAAYAPDLGVVVLVGWTSLVGIGASGKQHWTAERLCSDGFDEVRVTSTTVVVRGFDAPSDREVETTLDLRTGERVSRR
jgi:hypothetical protein